MKKILPLDWTTPLPKVWIGFIIAGAFLFSELTETATKNTGGTGPITITIGIIGSIYWLFCIHRFHEILGELSNNKYPITPSFAWIGHLIPIFNIYWIFYWPIKFSKFINSLEITKMVPGGILGILILISIIIAKQIDGALGLVCLFGIFTYMVNKLHHHIENSKSLPV